MASSSLTASFVETCHSMNDLGSFERLHASDDFTYLTEDLNTCPVIMRQSLCEKRHLPSPIQKG
jgi:hypothetical protein